MDRFLLPPMMELLVLDLLSFYVQLENRINMQNNFFQTLNNRQYWTVRNGNKDAGLYHHPSFLPGVNFWTTAQEEEIQSESGDFADKSRQRKDIREADTVGIFEDRESEKSEPLRRGLQKSAGAHLSLWLNTDLYKYRVIFHETRNRQFSGNTKLKNTQNSHRSWKHSRSQEPK